MFHSFKDGKSTINGYLEDYAAVIDGFIGLYEITLDSKWIQNAREMAEYTFTYFFDTDKSMFYFTSKEDAALVTRNIEYRDNVIPASNSIMAKNLFTLAHHFEDEKFADTARQMLKNIEPEIEQYPSGFSNWLDLLENYQSKYYEIVIMGDNAVERTKEINQYFIPNKLIAGSTKAETGPLFEGRFVNDETLIYVCVNNTCKLPVREAAKAVESLINL